MSLRYFLHILFKRKWYILAALLFAPLFAAIFLLFVEPVYMSKCKLEVHDRQDERDPLRPAKSVQKDDTFIQAQIELIFTDTVMEKVVDKAKLLPTPPSQSIFARYTGRTTSASKYDQARERIEAVRNVKKHVTADALSPVILNITAQENTPELAQATAQGVLDSYLEEFSRLQKENAELRQIFEGRLKSLRALIDESERELEDFHKVHPQATGPASQALLVPQKIDTTAITPPHDGSKAEGGPVYLPRASEISPVQKITQIIAELEIESIRVEAKYNKESYQYKNIVEQIENNKKLLNRYRQDLSEQNVLAVKERELNWRLDTLRRSYEAIQTDKDKVVNNLDVKELIKGTIITLDPPTLDPQPIFPKKALILVASMFVGLLLGLGLAYIAHVLDATYHLPEDFAADTGLPVLAAIPFQKLALAGEV